ncbi:MAG: DUF4160 domain-containing protein [Tepidimonas ignava]
MYWDDHEPPHFHVAYGDYSAVYVIETLTMLRGALPRRAHAMVLEWAAAHRANGWRTGNDANSDSPCCRLRRWTDARPAPGGGGARVAAWRFGSPLRRWVRGVCGNLALAHDGCFCALA